MAACAWVHFNRLFGCARVADKNRLKWGSERFMPLLLDTIETSGGKLKTHIKNCPLNFMLKCGSSKEKGKYSKKMDTKKKTELVTNDFAVKSLAPESLIDE